MSSSYVDRMLGAARLDPATFEEVEADRSATPQAAGVVVLSSVAAGIGAMGHGGPAPGLLVGTLAALVGWLIWATLTWAIGTKLLPVAETKADVGELLRTIGFAAAPGVLRVGGVVPGVGPLIVLAGSIWMLAATVVGVRQALDYTSTWRAVGVCAIGWLILLLFQAFVFVLISGGETGGVQP